MKALFLHILLLGFLVLPSWSCQGQDSIHEAKVGHKKGDSFGQLVQDLSGKPGYFDTDNLISNESSYLHVIPQLASLNIRGGAYLGVGPDQNFSYIAHIQPSIAFIIDIRRDNMLMHLLYKALFELADQRIHFLAYLFARDINQTQPGTASLTISEVMDEIETAPKITEGAVADMQKKIERRIQSYGVNLSDKDLATIRRFHNEFIQLGPSLRFTSHNRSPRNYYPTYKQLMSEQDLDGKYASFLSQEQLFQFLKGMHEADKIIPVVGNFAAPEVIPAIAAYLEKNQEEVSSFYTSNVEYYLMYQGQYPAFLKNIDQLPRMRNGVIIRSYFNRFRSTHPHTVSGYASTQLLQSMETMLSHPEATYSDLIFEHFIPR